jgi:hypothetical protein
MNGKYLKSFYPHHGWVFLLSAERAESKKQLNLSVLCVSAVNYYAFQSSQVGKGFPLSPGQRQSLQSLFEWEKGFWLAPCKTACYA